MDAEGFALAVVYGEHNRIRPALRPNARWRMSRETWQYLCEIDHSDHLRDHQTGELLGKPVDFDDKAVGLELRTA